MSRRQSCYIKYCASCENSTQPTAKKKIINSCFETPINSKITNRLLLLGAPAKKSRGHPHYLRNCLLLEPKLTFRFLLWGGEVEYGYFLELQNQT